jgi:hypothetical protein
LDIPLTALHVCVNGPQIISFWMRINNPLEDCFATLRIAELIFQQRKFRNYLEVYATVSILEPVPPAMEKHTFSFLKTEEASRK